MDALALISKVELEKLRAYDGKKPALERIRGRRRPYAPWMKKLLE